MLCTERPLFQARTCTERSRRLHQRRCTASFNFRRLEFQLAIHKIHKESFPTRNVLGGRSQHGSRSSRDAISLQDDSSFQDDYLPSSRASDPILPWGTSLQPVDSTLSHLGRSCTLQDPWTRATFISYYWNKVRPSGRVPTSPIRAVWHGVSGVSRTTDSQQTTRVGTENMYGYGY